VVPLSLDRRRPSSQARTPTMVVMIPKTMATAVSFDMDVIVIGWSFSLWINLPSRDIWNGSSYYTVEKGGHVGSYKFHCVAMGMFLTLRPQA